ncbi:nidogen-2-like isoform X2 [Amblyomma americanum]
MPPSPAWYLVVLVAAPLLLVGGQMFFRCSSMACKEPCRQLACSHGRLLHNATTCGCCPVCVRILGEGEACRNKEMASIPGGECGPMLSCVDAESRACVRDLLRQERHQGDFESPYGGPRPDCDDYGDYRPTRCKKGLTCNCVDKKGQRIFGTAIHSQASDMHCNCSRLSAESSWARPEQRLRCTAQGSFEPLQCSDSHCYCLRQDGSLDGRPVPRGAPLQHLKCYEKGRPLIGECMAERLRVAALLRKEAEEGGEPPFIRQVPSCDPDGTYAPRQCADDRCYCVRSNGQPYDKQRYSVLRCSEAAKNMTCNCLRDQELLREAFPAPSMLVADWGSQRCGPDGDYVPMQCPTSWTCRCVDRNGYQDSPDVMTWERSRLPCYRPEYDQYNREEIEASI